MIFSILCSGKVRIWLTAIYFCLICNTLTHMFFVKLPDSEAIVVVESLSKTENHYVMYTVGRRSMFLQLATQCSYTG